MALNFPKFNFAQADTKTRLFIIMSVASSVFFLGYVGYGYFKKGPVTAGPSKVAATPGLQSVPGSQLSPEYYRALMQANAQASKQAQMTGGSAVPTLVNIQNQPPAGVSSNTLQTGSANCSVVCPSPENANVADTITDLVKSGKISQEEAGKLSDLAKNNVSVAEYASALDALVKQGKLTPEQARQILETYKQQHQNAMVAESEKSMDALIKSGALSVESANDLLALQKERVSPADYSAELSRLVKEGKITPAVAAALLAQYTQQKTQEQASETAASLQQMAASGQIAPEVASDLIALQKRNAPIDEYAAELNRLVAAGKMTPATAAKLLDQYKANRASLLVGGTLSQLLDQGGPVGAEAQKLLDLQGNNATLEQYSAELKRAVAAGIITPEVAAQLLKEYQTTLSAQVTANGTLPTIDTNIPGVSDFAKLSQRLATEAPAASAPGAPGAVANQQQFTLAQAQAQQALEQERQQRIDDIQNKMSQQASQLVSAWQPVPMAHVQGSWTPSSGQGGESGAGGAGGTLSSKSSSNPLTAAKPSIIKAGAILFAVLDTAVDSDYPDTPVMATIVQGEFKGARLLGKLNLAKDQDRVSLNFTLMDMDKWPAAKNISAFAIDPDTARTVLANNVNHHYLSRYGAMMASSFLQGYANAIQNSGATKTTGIFGTTTTTSPMNPSQKIMVGLGQVGTAFSSVVASYINTPTTVKVNSGVGLGILFVSAVS